MFSSALPQHQLCTWCACCSMKQLQFISLDMLFAGMETTFTTMKWAQLYMVTHPEIQVSITEQIDKVALLYSGESAKRD